MEFRIGVHMGDVAVEGERIYGDGVNIAARLEGLAEPGGSVFRALSTSKFKASWNSVTWIFDTSLLRTSRGPFTSIGCSTPRARKTAGRARCSSLLKLARSDLSPSCRLKTSLAIRNRNLSRTA